jgi:hypothetical protein
MSFRSRIPMSIAVLLAGVLASGSCRRSTPVATVKMEPASVELAHPFVAPLTFRWSPTAPLDGLAGKPRVFVHVLDGGRRLLRTFDHPLPEAWTPGRPQSYEIELYQSAIADKLPPGAYEITVGLYDDHGKTRWPLATDGEEVGRREYRLGSLVSPAADPPAPRFEFSGGWLPVEPGSSKQVVARRCLRGEGRISVLTAPSGGTVRVAASILSAEGSSAGSVAGAWRISATCARESLEVSGREMQWVDFPVAAEAAAPSCEIRFTPPIDSPDPLCLEVLAWRPAAG